MHRHRTSSGRIRALCASAVVALAALVAAACGSAPSQQPGGGGGKGTVTVAVVNNPDMEIMKNLAGDFTKKTGLKAKFVVLPDQQLRQKITQDVAQGTGAYDVVMISPYEVQSGFAKNKWLEPLNPRFEKMKDAERTSYNLDDVLAPIRNALSVNGQLYALPFYGESNFTYYRKDLFKKAGLTMPESPTWDQIRGFAAKLNRPKQGQYGIVLKGVPDYGQLAPFITFTNSFGARWFDESWHPQFTSPQFRRAARAYVDLVRKYGEPGASSVGYNEGLGLMSQGKGAIWVDATVAAGTLNDPKQSKVTDKIGYALAPTEGCDKRNWLFTWALGVSAASKNKDAAFKFLTWATSPDYVKTVAAKYGWSRVPPGTRKSTYEQPEYKKVAPWAKLTLKSIEGSNLTHPSCQNVPYTGNAQINIPEYADFAFDFGQGFSAAVIGKKSVDAWLKEAQANTERVMKKSGYIKD